jgi:cellulose synthase/poly-beta-1,6-N-acetylglucosamine synthase-like glycosyltransferase
LRRGDALGRAFTKAILYNDNFSSGREIFRKDVHPLNYNVGVVIPSLNEEKNIGQVLTRLNKIGFTNILVIDGLSNDDTRKVAAENGAKIVLQVGRGKG